MIAFKGFLPAPAAVLAALVSAAGAAWAGFRSLERGAVGHLDDVSGPAAPDVFKAPQGAAAGAH